MRAEILRLTERNTNAFINGERGDVHVTVEAPTREDAIAILEDAGFDVA